MTAPPPRPSTVPTEDPVVLDAGWVATPTATHDAVRRPPPENGHTRPDCDDSRGGSSSGGSRLARQSIGYGGGRVAGIALQTLVVALLARVLGADAYGALAAGLALTSVIDAVSDFGIGPTSIVSMGAAPERADEIAAVVRRANLAMLVVALVLVTPVLIGYSTDARWAMVSLLPSLVVQRLVAGQVALRRHRLELTRINIAELAGRLTSTLLVLGILVTDRPPSRQIALVGVAFFVGALVTASLVATRRSASSLVGWTSTRSLIVGALPLGVTGALSLVHVRADQVLLEVLGHREELAAYSLGYRAVESVVGVLAIATGAVFAFVAALESKARRTPASRALRHVSVLSLMATAGLFAAAEPLGVALGGDAGGETAALIRLLAPVIWLSAVNMLVAQLCIVEGEQRWLLGVAAGVTALNVALGFVAIPLAGAAGASIATLVTELLGVTVTIHHASRRLGLVDRTALAPELAALGGLVAAGLLWGAGQAPGFVCALGGLGSVVFVLRSRRGDLADVVTLVLRRPQPLDPSSGR